MHNSVLSKPLLAAGPNFTLHDTQMIGTGKPYSKIRAEFRTSRSLSSGQERSGSSFRVFDAADGKIFPLIADEVQEIH